MPTECGEDGATGGEEVWPLDASPQNRDLVTQGQDLGVLLALSHAGERDQSNEYKDARSTRGHGKGSVVRAATTRRLPGYANRRRSLPLGMYFCAPHLAGLIDRTPGEQLADPTKRNIVAERA